MTLKNAKEKCRAIGLKAPTAIAYIEILAPLQGYSKREDLFEKEYYKQVGKKAARSPKSNFKHLTLKLLKYGLLQDKDSESGYRLSLNKAIWEQDVETLDILSQYALLLFEGMRSDSQVSTAISKVRKMYEEDVGNEITYSQVEPVVAYAICENFPDAELGKFKPFKYTKRSEAEILEKKKTVSQKKKMKPVQVKDSDQTDLFSSYTPKPTAIKKSHSKLWPNKVLDFLKDRDFQALFHPSQEIIVSIKLAQNRTQQVYVVPCPDKDGFLQVETISGPYDDVADNVQEIFRHNDKFSVVKIATMQRRSIEYIGCLSFLTLEEGNLEKLPDIIVDVANLGDELENAFWDQDLF